MLSCARSYPDPLSTPSEGLFMIRSPLGSAFASSLFLALFTACHSSDNKPTCTAGNETCACKSDGTCSGTLACVSNVCMKPTSMMMEPGPLGFTQPLPVTPKCYTPCRTGHAKANGTYVPCNAEGLLEGCVGNNVCTNGTC